MNISEKELVVLIERAKQLRVASDTAEKNFMQFLQDLEQRQVHVGHYATFDALLFSAQICDSHRYRNWLVAADRIGVDTVDSIGYEASVALSKVPDENIAPAVAVFTKYRTEHGCTPSARTARDIAKHFSPVKPLRLEKRITLEQQLKDEVKRLKTELKAAQKRIKELEAQAGAAATAAE